MIVFPKNTKVGKIVAKENFYSRVDNATKILFQNEISRIIWEYKLAPSTINLPAKKWPEIEVFRVVLKKSEISEKVLCAIDSAIPYPILFIVESGSLEKAIVCYKEQSQKDINSTKVDIYFSTAWNDEKLDGIKIDGLTIDAVFSNFVRQIAGDKLSNPETLNDETLSSIKEDVEKMKEQERIQKQIDMLTRKINNEPSIGKKQELAEKRYKMRSLLK